MDMLLNFIGQVDLKLVVIVMLAVSLFLQVNKPEKMSLPFTKFSIGFLTSFVVVNELINIFYNIIH